MIVRSNVNWRNKTILIVEDDWANYLYLKEVVSELGAKMLYARNGVEAVEFCKKEEEINMILMDIKMPEMNGYEATMQIKKIKPNLPIIAQSAYALQNEIYKYNDVFDGYITKPINIDTLKEELEKHFVI
ncbi:MAG: response regulator [Bacteroidales bacterium]|nr:response regulator [Bacteroidales bacterium]